MGVPTWRSILPPPSAAWGPMSTFGPFENQGDAEHFLGLVEATLRPQCARLEFEEGRVNVWYHSDAGALPETPPHQQYGITNLAQVCALAPRPQWEQIINGHFEGVRQAESEGSAIEQQQLDFNAVCDRIKLRLYPSTWQDFEGALHRSVAPGLEGTLVFDLPHSLRSVAPALPAAWGIAEERLFELGLQNVAADGLLQPQPLKLPNNGAALAFASEQFFTSTHLLLLERYVPAEQHPHGAVVAVPNRHLLLLHPLTSLRLLVNTIPGLVALVINAYNRGPGSLSRNLFWFHGGHLRLLPVSEQEGEPVFAPPLEFMEYVQQQLPLEAP